MSQLIARILLSMLMFPVAVLVAIMAAIIGDSFSRSMFNSYREREYSIAIGVTLIAWFFVAVYWVLLWRKLIRWNSTRIMATILSVPVIIVISVMIGAVIEGAMGRSGPGPGVFIACVSAPLLWIFATILIWRETAAERADRIKSSSTKALVCPTCGYNLTGLHEARCPECGTRFTLDELVAAQPGHEIKEIEV